MKTDLLEIYNQYPKVLELYRDNLILKILPKKLCLSKYKLSCEESFYYKKKKRYSAQTKIQQGRSLPYPYYEKKLCKTFQIKYEKQFSYMAKLLLTSFKNKYIYYALEDINLNISLDLFEKNHLIFMLHSVMVWLQNNNCISLFDIWIGNIYISETKQTNRFLKSKTITSTIITLVLFYKISKPRQKYKPLW